MKKWFTLVEMLIALAVLGILLVLLFRVYWQILNISLRLQNEKKFVREVDFAFTKVQTLIDQNFLPSGSDSSKLLLVNSGENLQILLKNGGVYLSWEEFDKFLTFTWIANFEWLKFVYFTWEDNYIWWFAMVLSWRLARYNPAFWPQRVDGIYQQVFDTSFKDKINQ